MRFVLSTAFLLRAPRLAVYQTIRDVAAWPTWWRGCLAVDELAPGDAQGHGARQRIVWRGRLPYRVAVDVRIVHLQRGECIRAVADGDVQGTGCWRFADADGGTSIVYDWDVELRRRWMQRAAPLLKPLFRLNHDRLMTAGANGLAQRLRVPPPVVQHTGHVA